MEKINKEYPILSNWKFVFKEMYDLDHKYPWYIAVRSVAGFLAPFIAAIIPSAAISMVEKKADFLTFFGVMLAFVLGNMIMGIVSTKYDFLIKKQNYDSGLPNSGECRRKTSSGWRKIQLLGGMEWLESHYGYVYAIRI